MRFKVDENLHIEIAALLRDRVTMRSQYLIRDTEVAATETSLI